jgi:hypothetical protein
MNSFLTFFQKVAALRISTFKMNQLQIMEREDSGKYLEQIFLRYKNLFVETLGAVPEFKITLPIMPGTRPMFLRSFPNALLDRFDREIDKLEVDGIIERIEYTVGVRHSHIVKSDKTIRRCADCKTTINQFLHGDK